MATSEANAAANSFTIASIYIWRPSTSAVVGFIYDSDTALGVEWATTEDGQVLSPAGASLAVLAGDVLVIEFWRHATQAMAAVYTQTLFFDGTTDVVDATTADAASYLESPAVLNFQVQLFERAISEPAISISESVSRLKTGIRNISEPAISASESVTRTKTIPRTVSEPTVSVSEAVSRLKMAARSISEPAITVSETVTRTRIKPRSISEPAISVSESVVRRKSASRSISEPALSVSESVVATKFSPITRSITEPAIVVQENVRVQKLGTILTSVSVSEPPLKVSDSVTVAKTLARFAGFKTDQFKGQGFFEEVTSLPTTGLRKGKRVILGNDEYYYDGNGWRKLTGTPA